MRISWTTTSYNGGATLNYSYDTTQRITGLTASGLSGLTSPLLSNVTYVAAGLQNATLGASPGALAENRTYGYRNWLTTVTVGSGPAYSLSNLTFSGNGNVTAANDSANTNWTYTYDDFNRLKQATNTSTTPNQIYQYLYDRFGNRWQQNYVQGQGPNYGIQLTFNSNNQINGIIPSPSNGSPYRYDAAGNLLMDVLYCYSYDAENRLVSVAPQTGSGSGVCAATTMTTAMSYLYDPDGRRVARLHQGSIVKQYYYDAAGHMITEADASGNTLRAEIYAGSRHLATWSNNATYFNHADWLGTERVRTNSSGAVCETITSLPFGDGQVPSGSCTPTPIFFTGKERDSESGLDYFGARHNTSSLGRFMTPDPLHIEMGRLGDPQQLNLYQFARDNPLTFTDSTGLLVDLNCAQVSSDECNQMVSDLNSRMGAAFQVTRNGNGNLQVVNQDKVDVGKLSASEAALFNVVTDPNHTARLDVVPESDTVQFGRFEGAGLNTIDASDMRLLAGASPEAAGEVVAHEALEAYHSLTSGIETDYKANHAYADQYFGQVTHPFNADIPAGAGSPAVNLRSWQMGRLSESFMVKTVLTPIPAVAIQGAKPAYPPGRIVEVRKEE